VSSGGRIRRFFLTISFHDGSLCSYNASGTSNRPSGGHTSETKSHPIDMIIIIIVIIIIIIMGMEMIVLFAPNIIFVL
jgi:sulfite exporter TauE/SafE